MANLNISIQFLKRFNPIISQLAKYKSILLLLILLLFPVINLWNLPLSEDAGFYAYLSRAVMHGAILHNDIPVSTNSLAIYLMAELFRIFGSSVNVYRFFHLIFYIGLVVVVFKLARTFLNEHFAFISALIAGYLITIPHVNLDLGRNYIMLATFFLFIGSIFHLSTYRNKFVYVGIFFALSSLIRETFLIFPLAYFVNHFMIDMGGRKNIFKSNSFMFLYGVGGIFLLNLLLSIFDGNFISYLKDMLHSGTQFRYGATGFFSFKRIFGNLTQLIHGYSHFYAPIIWLGVMSYLIPSKYKALSFIKFFLTPLLLVVALIINATISYSVIPILCLFSVMSFFTLSTVLGWTQTKISDLKLLNFLIALLALIFLFKSAEFILNISNEYKAYFNLSKEIKSRKKSHTLDEVNENTFRMLSIINSIPHKTISTYSQYPLLFLSNYNYPNKYPFIEDLSGPGNMDKPQIWLDQLKSLDDSTADLLVIKTSVDGYLSRWTDLGSIIDKRYIPIVDFGFSPGGMIMPYKSRILMSKKFFIDNFKLLSANKILGACEDSPNMQFLNQTNNNKILKINLNQSAKPSLYKLSSKVTEAIYDNNYTSELSIYALVAPGKALNLNHPICGDVVFVEEYGAR